MHIKTPVCLHVHSCRDWTQTCNDITLPSLGYCARSAFYLSAVKTPVFNEMELHADASTKTLLSKYPASIRYTLSIHQCSPLKGFHYFVFAQCILSFMGTLQQAKKLILPRKGTAPVKSSQTVRLKSR